MPSLGFELTRRRVWGAVKHGAMKAWHFGPVSIWWTAGPVSEEFEANRKTLQSASAALRRAVMMANRTKVRD